MTANSELQQQVSRLQRRYDQLRDKAAFTEAARKLGETATGISGMPGEIQKLRDRGYAFAGYLGSRAEALQAQWNEVRERIDRQVQEEVERLRGAVAKLDPLVAKMAAPGAAEAGVRHLVTQVEGQLDALESEVEGAEKRIDALYGHVDRDLNEITQQIRKFNWYMDMADEATFDFGATEAVYMVAKAEWVKTGKGKDDPDGLIYITDQRLIFERREKEGGFLGFGGKKVQGIAWEVPLAAIADVKAEKKGMLGGKDMIYLEFSSGGPGNPTTLEVKGGINANWYAQQLRRAIAGEIDQERALEVDPGVLEAVRSAPTECASCGAPFSMPITRGMSQIVCEYCGAVTRIG